MVKGREQNLGGEKGFKMTWFWDYSRKEQEKSREKSGEKKRGISPRTKVLQKNRTESWEKTVGQPGSGDGGKGDLITKPRRKKKRGIFPRGTPVRKR